MAWVNNADSPSRRFLTPPPTWKSRPRHSPTMPMSESKWSSPPVNKADNFHVIHKVPAGDSPYVKAKQVQLIDKDPSRAISLFWAAINAGDRVDSALKDMAIVMKQLNRADEAIEAIKSFRHLCPYDAQGSLDNVLVELYKRSGRIEEEIEMLQRKLKNIEEGTAFCGKRTKIARSQGKKIQITIEQEKSRILGNLAWAYMQLNNYTTAEEIYRKALSLEPDKNKQCNLAICLMHLNRITEAKSLLLDVKASSRHKELDESCANSLERGLQMLNELESESVLQPTENEADNRNNTQRSSMLPVNRNLEEAFGSMNGGQDYLSGSTVSRRDGSDEETVVLNEQKRGLSGCHHLKNQESLSGQKSTPLSMKNSSLCSPQTAFVDRWNKGSFSENPRDRQGSSPGENQDNAVGINVSSARKNEISSPASVGNYVKAPSGINVGSASKNEFSVKAPSGINVGSASKNEFSSPASVGNYVKAPSGINVGSASKNEFSSPASVKNYVKAPSVEPRRSSWGFNNSDQRRDTWQKNAVGSSHRKLSFDQPITHENVQAPTVRELNDTSPAASSSFKDMQKSEAALPSLMKGDWRKSSGAHDMGNGDWKSSWNNKGYAHLQNGPVESDSHPVVNRERKRYALERDGGKTKLPAETPVNVDHARASKTIIADGDWRSSWKRNVYDQVPNGVVTRAVAQPVVRDDQKMNSLSRDGEKTKLHTEASVVVADARASETIVYEGRNQEAMAVGDCLMARSKKSWADMVEEEEEELLHGSSFSWNVEEEFNDENLDSNVTQPTPVPQGQIETISKKMETFDLEDHDGHYSSSLAKKASNLKDQSVLVSNENKRKSRLKVFRDITDAV